MHNAAHCVNCDSYTKVKRRDFSAQAWSALLVWGEIDESAVDRALCDPCYAELREVLIDRADEIDGMTKVAINQKGQGKAGTAGKVA